jgi:hypothetical protein
MDEIIALRNTLNDLIASSQSSEPYQKFQMFERLDHAMRCCSFSFVGCACVGGPTTRLEYDQTRRRYIVQVGDSGSTHTTLSAAIEAFLQVTDH